MKTFNYLYSEIISLPNLYRAFEKAKKGKKKRRFLIFEKDLHENLWQLHLELYNKTYSLLPYYTFYVTDYKKRKIMSPSFRDQIVQHAIFNYLEQVYEKIFIYDSYACRKNKGTHRACLRLRKMILKHSSNSYFMKCDITKYFYSIDHYRLKSIIRKKINDENLLWLIDKIIDSHTEGHLDFHIDNLQFTIQEKGIPIGNLMSQLFANIYLNELDYFIKQKMKIKHYLRYVDDFILIIDNSVNNNILKQNSPDREFSKKDATTNRILYIDKKENLHKIFLQIKTFLSENLFLKLESKKTQINKLFFGIDFVGYVCFKRFVRIRTLNYRRFKTKFKLKCRKYLSDELSFDSFYSSFAGYFGHLNHTNSNKIKNLIEMQYIKVIAIKAVKRGGNWNNGANAGVFYANLNNAPSNTNNNIGFRCCSEHGEKILSSRRFYTSHAHLQLHSFHKMKTRAGTEQVNKSVVPAMTNQLLKGGNNLII